MTVLNIRINVEFHKLFLNYFEYGNGVLYCWCFYQRKEWFIL